MKTKPLIFFVVIELTVILVGGVLGILVLDTKREIQNIECSVDCCDDDDDENIRVTSPGVDDVVTSPLVITGEARGTWYFEGDFPVALYDKDCRELVRGYVSSQEPWMVPDFVPFEGTIEFDPGDSTTGALVLEKDNPTGCVQYDDNLIIPVRFE